MATGNTSQKNEKSGESKKKGEQKGRGAPPPGRRQGKRRTAKGRSKLGDGGRGDLPMGAGAVRSNQKREIGREVKLADGEANGEP